MRREHDSEPVRGLPGRLPEGEHVLWQGAPHWAAFARRAFHTRKIAIYFGVLMAWRLIDALYQGMPVGEAAAYTLWLLPLALPCLAILFLLAWGMARTTVYTITNRRVVLRFGLAIQKAINIPFQRIVSASLKGYPNGTGDIPLALADDSRMPFLLLWPHVRPWRFSRAEPMLRAIPDAENVAKLLSNALRTAADSPEVAAPVGSVSKSGKSHPSASGHEASSGLDLATPAMAGGR